MLFTFHIINLILRMQKNHTQLLLGLLIGLVVGLLLGHFVFVPKQQNVNVEPAKNNSVVVTTNNNEALNEINKTKDRNTNVNKSANNQGTQVQQDIPNKVLDVLQYIKQNGKAMDGYVGGRVFQNRENQLPMNDDNGNKINYQEWDVNPKVNGQNRGTQRMVTGSDGRSWYTSDHYRSFTLIKK